MHEVDMTRALLLTLQHWREEQAPAHPIVQRLHLLVGAFTCVEPQALLHTWEAAVQDSWLAGSELRIETVPLRARCLACGAAYTPVAAIAYRSPCCGHPMEEILQGRELRIDRIDYTLEPIPSATAPLHASTAGSASARATTPPQPAPAPRP
jgi:hydrogenase nickel incorporation protein HypA/HybF